MLAHSRSLEVNGTNNSYGSFLTCLFVFFGGGSISVFSSSLHFFLSVKDATCFPKSGPAVNRFQKLVLPLSLFSDVPCTLFYSISPT